MAKRLRSDAVLGMGPEPIWVGEFNKTKLIDALNWYNYCYDQKKAKELIVSYCRHAKYDKKTIQHVKSIPDSKIILQVAWISRMLILGMVPDENTQKFFDDGLEKMLTYKGIRAKVVVKDTPKISVQDRILEKAREEAGEIEGLIDEYIASGCKLKYDLQKYFNGKNLSAVVLQRMCEMFIISSKEIAEAISGEDEQIKEAYSHFTKPQLKKLSEFYGDIVSTTNKTAIANKPTRKKRRVKEKPVTQIVSKVKFLEEHSGFKCVPIEKVVGADQVWTYNIKTKMLGLYNSDNAKGLTFKGTTLKNFNTKSSVGKRLRKPEVIIPELMSAGKVKIKKILPQLTTKEQGLTGRFNCDTIVLKIT